MEQAGFAGAVGQPVRRRVMKTSVISRRVPRRATSRTRPTGARSRAARSCSRARRTTTSASTTRRWTSTRTASWSSAASGPIGYPGAAEVVNMQPPDALMQRGITLLPCVGDGRQSGTSGSPSILNASPEAAVGRRPGAAADRRPRPHRPQASAAPTSLSSEADLEKRRKAWKAAGTEAPDPVAGTATDDRGPTADRGLSRLRREVSADRHQHGCASGQSLIGPRSGRPGRLSRAGPGDRSGARRRPGSTAECAGRQRLLLRSRPRSASAPASTVPGPRGICCGPCR